MTVPDDELTRLRAQNTALLRENRELNEQVTATANRLLDELVTVISHELRSPLASMLIYGELLRGGESDPVRLKRAGESIERGTRTQLQIIEDLVEVSRLTTGKLRLERRPVDLAAVLHAAWGGLVHQAEGKQISARICIGEAVGLVSGDRARLQKVMARLLLCGIKLTPSGGVLTAILDSAAGRPRLRVTNGDQGMDAGVMATAFHQFAPGAVGMGLAIVRHIVELHGGSAEATSAGADQEAAFTLTFPRIDAV